MKKVMLFVALVGWPMFLRGAAAAPSIELQEIVDTLRARQQKLRTVQLVWKATETYVKHYWDKHEPGDVPGPPEDSTIEETGRLWLDREKQRLVDEGPKFCPSTNRFERRDDVYTYDGTVSKTYSPPEPGAYAAVSISNDEMDKPIAAIPDQVLAWSFRGYDIFAKTPIDQWSASRARGPGGVDCILLRNVSDGYSIWFAAKPDLPLVRVESRDEGTLDWQLDVETRPDDNFGWLPVSWKFAELDSDRMRHTVSANVTEVVINQPIDPGLFDFKFPAGTEVCNHITKESYVVLEDDKRAPYTYEGKTRVILRNDSHSLRWIIVSMTAVLFAALVIVYFVRRRRFASRAAK